MKDINCIDLIDKEVVEFVNILNLDDCDLLEIFKIKEKDLITRNLGDEYNSYDYVELSNKKDNSKIELWFKEKQIKKINVVKTWENQNLIKKQISLLEKPSIKLDYYFDVIKMEKGTWVYPKKGIAIFWGFENKAIFKVSYFHPMSSKKYINFLHPVERQREF